MSIQGMLLPDLQQSLPHLHFPLPSLWALRSGHGPCCLLAGVCSWVWPWSTLAQVSWHKLVGVTALPSLARRLPQTQFQEGPEAEGFVTGRGHMEPHPPGPCDATYRMVEGSRVADTH